METNKEQRMTHSTDEWEYHFNAKNEITLTKYLKRAPTEVEFPDTIGGYPVTSLGARLFKNRKTLEIVVLPKGLRYIGDEAFYGCESLALYSMDLPETLVQIGNRAFQKCTLVGDTASPSDGDSVFTFPPSCEFIGEHAFYGVNGYGVNGDKLVVPSTIKFLGKGAFARSELHYVRCEHDASEECFCYCGQLEKAIINGSVNNRAFFYCKKLKDVELKEDVANIGVASFEETAIESIAFPKSLKTICDYAFSGCEALRRVTFANVASMRNSYCSAFWQTSVEEVVLPSEIQNAIDNGKKLNKKQAAFVKKLVNSGLKSYSVLMALAATV